MGLRHSAAWNVIGALLVGAVAAQASISFHSRPAARAGFATCDEATPDCRRRLAEIDVRLDAAYRRALAGLPPEQQERLRTADREWNAFREADCVVFGSRSTGSDAAGSCRIRRAEERIADLETITR